jgi:hypothetical protein
MSVVYELWDVESGNWLERFDSESDALRAAREFLELNAGDFIEALVLGAFRYDGETGTVERLPALAGDVLLTRIRSLDPVPLSAAAAAPNPTQRSRDVPRRDRSPG